MMKRFLLALALVGSALSGVTHVAFAQTKEFEHPQTKDPKAQVHIQGVAPDPAKTFTQQYAPVEDITTNGHRITWLFEYTSWVCFIFFVIMSAGLGWFIFAYRERPGHKAFYTHGHSSKNKLVTKSLDIAVFLSLDLVLLIASFRDTRDFIWKYPDGPDVVKVQIMPQQWVWNFKYAGTDGIFGTPDDIDTINDLRVPVGRPVLVEVKAKDVIHGFRIEAIRMQIDAIPGEVVKFWFDTTKTGDFEIACAHHCGTSHYKMKAFLKVLEPADYAAWNNEMSTWAAAKYDPDDVATHWGWKWGF